MRTKKFAVKCDLVKRFIIFTIFYLYVNSISAMELVIKPESDVMDNREINVLFHIKNNNNKGIVMPLVLVCADYYLRIKVINDAGEEAPFVGEMLDLEESSDHELMMPPDSEFIQKINLATCFKLSSGIYKVTATYHIHKNDRLNKHTWSGQLRSNSTIIKIKE